MAVCARVRVLNRLLEMSGSEKIETRPVEARGIYIITPDLFFSTYVIFIQFTHFINITTTCVIHFFFP